MNKLDERMEEHYQISYDPNILSAKAKQKKARKAAQAQEMRDHKKVAKSFLKHALKLAEEENKALLEMNKMLVDQNRVLTEENLNLTVSENTEIISLLLPSIIEEDKHIMQHQEYLKNRTDADIASDNIEDFRNEVRWDNTLSRDQKDFLLGQY